MDDRNAFGIELRVVKDAEHQGEQVRVVSGARTFDTEIEELWDAVTNAERIPLWFAPITGELRLGGRYQLKGNAGGEISRCDAPRALDVTWECNGNMSWVTLRLESVSDGVRLTLEHLMPKDKASDEHWRKYGPGATGVGWEFGFLALGLYLDSGDPIDEHETNTWSMSPDGKSFINKCASEWGEAHIRAGETRAISESMAKATATFYCGEE